MEKAVTPETIFNSALSAENSAIIAERAATLESTPRYIEWLKASAKYSRQYAERRLEMAVSFQEGKPQPALTDWAPYIEYQEASKRLTTRDLNW